jgi:hypothetical protein
VTTVPTTDDERVKPGRLAVAVFIAVVALIAIVFAVQLIPDAQRPTIRQVPHTTTTTIIIPAPTSP